MNPGNNIILISGAPGSGKTTLGRLLARQLSVPCIDKDDILESLFDSLGIGDHAWRARLSRASDVIFLSLLAQLEHAVAVSFWRHPKSQREDSGTPITQFMSNGSNTIEVYCSCDPTTAVTRFTGRKRHTGHLDGVVGDDRQTSARGIRTNVELGPLDIAQLIVADTNKPADVLSKAIARDILELWGLGNHKST